MENAPKPLHLPLEENATFLTTSYLGAKIGVSIATLLDVKVIDALVNPLTFEVRALVLNMPCLIAMPAGNVSSFSLASPASPVLSLDKSNSFTVALPNSLKPGHNLLVIQYPHCLHYGFWVVICALGHIIGKIVLQLLISQAVSSTEQHARQIIFSDNLLNLLQLLGVGIGKVRLCHPLR
jgi:hypothetical protein